MNKSTVVPGKMQVFLFINTFFNIKVHCKLLYMSPHRRGGGHVVFGVDPVGVGISTGIGFSVTLSYVQDISRYYQLKDSVPIKLLWLCMKVVFDLKDV